VRHKIVLRLVGSQERKKYWLCTGLETAIGVHRRELKRNPTKRRRAYLLKQIKKTKQRTFELRRDLFRASFFRCSQKVQRIHLKHCKDDKDTKRFLTKKERVYVPKK
jgi:hypothetical protein